MTPKLAGGSCGSVCVTCEHMLAWGAHPQQEVNSKTNHKVALKVPFRNTHRREQEKVKDLK